LQETVDVTLALNSREQWETLGVTLGSTSRESQEIVAMAWEARPGRLAHSPILESTSREL
jgi:hypothetical protein